MIGNISFRKAFSIQKQNTKLIFYITQKLVFLLTQNTFWKPKIHPCKEKLEPLNEKKKSKSKQEICLTWVSQMTS